MEGYCFEKSLDRGVCLDRQLRARIAGEGLSIRWSSEKSQWCILWITERSSWRAEPPFCLPPQPLLYLLYFSHSIALQVASKGTIYRILSEIQGKVRRERKTVEFPHSRYKKVVQEVLEREVTKPRNDRAECFPWEGRASCPNPDLSLGSMALWDCITGRTKKNLRTLSLTQIYWHDRTQGLRNL